MRSKDDSKAVSRVRSHAPNVDDVSRYLFGKVQPQAPDVEEAILGSVLIERDAVPLAVEMMKPEYFYSEKHQQIFESVIRLHRQEKSIDLITVTEELRTMGELEKIGGAFAVMELTNRVTSAANLEYYCMIVKQKWAARSLIEMGSGILRVGYEDTTDVYDLITTTQQQLNDLTLSFTKHGDVSLEKHMADTLKWMETGAAVSGSMLYGKPTFIETLDDRMGGAGNGELIVIAGRPGMGKSTLARQIALNMARRQLRVAVFSYESNARTVCINLLATHTGMDARSIRTVDVQKIDGFKRPAGELGKLPMFIYDDMRLTANDVQMICKRLKRRYGLDAVIIDQIQLQPLTHEDMRRAGNRDRELGIISRLNKQTAYDLDVPVFELSQLNRDVDKREYKIPMLSDLRESGNIEQDADVVMLLWRPEYYGIKDPNGYGYKDDLYIIGAKHRNGEPFHDNCVLKTNLNCGRMRSPANDDHIQYFDF